MEAAAEVTIKIPKAVSRGMAFDPQLQLSGFNLEMRTVSIPTAGVCVPLLPLGPDRLAFFLFVRPFGIVDVFYHPGTDVEIYGVNLTSGFQAHRVHSAEYPCLCQGEWMVGSLGGGASVEVWEVTTAARS
jgi:hypothetical protein